MRRHKGATKCPKQKTPQARKTTQAEDNSSGRQLKHRRPPQPRQPPQPPQARGHCTRYVAVHPLRGGAPEQKRCIAYGSGAAPQQTRTNAELAHRTTHRHTPPCAPGAYWRQDGHAAHATTCTPAHSDTSYTSYTLKCEEPDNLRSVRVGDISIDNPQGWYYLFPGSYRIEATPKNPGYRTKRVGRGVSPRCCGRGWCGGVR